MPSLFSGVLGALSQDIAIDLGTVNTVVVVRGRGVVAREPTLVSMYLDPRGARRVLAWGEDARAMLGRTPSDIEVVRPIHGGIIADFEVAESLLRQLLAVCMRPNHVVRPRTVVTVPYGITEVERRAVRECAEQAGAREVYLVDEPLAAAIGAGLEITEPQGNMVVDVGGGTTEIAVISMGGIVASRTVQTGGDAMDAAITEHLKDLHGLLIGPVTAEEIKIKLGSATEGSHDENLHLEVRGRDIVSGYPRAVTLTPGEVRHALKGCLEQIRDGVLATLAKTPPELAADIVDKGVVMTGGAAQLRRLDRYLGEATGLPVIVVDDPGAAVAMGAGLALERIELLRAVSG